MTLTPYTDTDLLALAARLHAGAARNTDDRIRPAVERKWDSLNVDQIDEACDEMVDLLDKAADVSEWAITLGAEGLKPAERCLVDGGEGGPVQAAFHIALDPHLELDPRAYKEIADVIRGHLAFRED